MSPLKTTNILLILFLIAAFATGFWAGRISVSKTSINLAPNSSTAVKESPLFQTQTAFISGKITNLEGNTATVSDLKDKTDQFPIISTVSVSSFKEGSTVASISAGLKQVKLDTEAQITLNKRDDHYEITSIMYLPPPLPLPLIKAGSTTPIKK